MKKNEAPAFADFMLDEATKYGRELQKAEIDLWFETFQRCTFDDFRLAWVAHKRDDKNGNFFPKIPWLQRHLRVTGDEHAKRDWRCEVTVGDARCGFPGSMSTGQHGGGPWHCAAHFRLFGRELSQLAVKDASAQVIEASASYKAPSTFDELYALNDARRAAAKKLQELEAKKRLPADAIEVEVPGMPEAFALDIPPPESEFTPTVEHA